MALRRSKQSKRQSRRQAKRQSKRQSQRKRQSRRQQRGGSGCAAFGNNYASVQQGGMAPMNYVMGQKGGMAPFNYDNALLIGDAATRMQAQANGLDSYVATSQALADKFGTPMFYKGLNQAGGRRKHKHSRRCTHRKQKQRGGNWHELQKFDAPYTSGFSDAVTGVNPQFHTEASVNALYGENRGPQF